jgi:hypothetical protein
MISILLHEDLDREAKDLNLTIIICNSSTTVTIQLISSNCSRPNHEIDIILSLWIGTRKIAMMTRLIHLKVN